MLDTCKLTRQEARPEMLKQHERWQYKTDSDGNILQQQAIIRLNETPAVDTFGNKQKQYYNGTIGIGFDFTSNFLNLHVSSLPALFYGSSFETLTTEDLRHVGERLACYLNEYTTLDIQDMKFCRLDNSAVYEMQKPVKNYIALLDDITRHSQFRLKKTYYQNETLQLRNNARLVGFYDKTERNKLNKVELEYLRRLADKKENALRYELQLRNMKAIRSAFKQDLTVDDLYVDKTIEMLYRQRKDAFNRHFRLTIGERKAKLQDLYTATQHMKDMKKKKPLDAAVWYVLLQQGTFTLEELEKIMLCANYTRQGIHQRLKALKELQAHNIEKTELFHELKAKVEAA